MGVANQNRMKIRLISLFCIRFLLGDIPSAVLALIPTNPVTTRRCPHHGRLSPLAVSLSSEQSLQQLQSKTVKELRHLLKESTLNRRGILSQLKKKQDLVEFLNDNLDSSELENFLCDQKRGESKESEEQLNPKPKVVRSRPMSMPAQSDASSESGTTSSLKEALFERIYEQYPPLKDQECLGIGENDIRQIYHPIFKNSKASGDMDIIFVGTASCSPGITRGVSCTALRLNGNTRRSLNGTPQGRELADSTAGGTWLFDCGECTQLQVQRTPSIRPSRINRIFITHAHGDHSFGLPGLLCLMGQDRDRVNSPPVEIYGPEGLRVWLRVAIRYSVSRIVPNYRVHELKDIPMAPEWDLNRKTGRYYYKGLRKNDPRNSQWGHGGLAGEDPRSWISRANMINLDPSPQYGEVDGGRDIYPIYDHPKSSDGAPVWEVSDEEDVKVFAAPMSHGIPCVGYVVEESSRPGRLRNDLVQPMVKRNLIALKEAGFAIPMKAMAVIKNLPVGSAFTFPDGTVLTQEEAVEPPRKGRKVVICGDTASSRALQELSLDADVVIHEATNSYLQGIDRDTDFKSVARETMIHGHSTPHIAGEFAKRVRAKKLLLNHFSARYKGDQSVETLSIMTRIEEQAQKASGLPTTEVAAAWDFMVLPLNSN